MAALAAGALSKVSVADISDSLVSAAATGGTAPYTYQWYRSETTGFTPGGGNIITGATSLVLNDSSLIPSTTYFYKVIATDSAAATSTATQLSVTTTQPQAGGQNAFQLSPILGMNDLPFNQNTISVEVDSSQATPLVAGQGVKVVNSAGGIPKVIACAANTDVVFGFINFDVKSQTFPAGARCEISMSGNVMYLYATNAIARGAQVTLDVTSPGAVGAKNTGDQIVGFALDQAAGFGSLIRVHIKSPTFQAA